MLLLLDDQEKRISGTPSVLQFSKIADIGAIVTPMHSFSFLGSNSCGPREWNLFKLGSLWLSFHGFKFILKHIFLPLSGLKISYLIQKVVTK